ncbi:MAG: DedA family protein [Mycobacterium leprae]
MLTLWQSTPLQLVAVLLAGLLEGLGLPGPGSLILAGIGVAATADTAVAALAATAAVFGIGYCMGSLGQYWMGRRLGPKALSKLSRKHQLLVARTLNRFGGAAVLLSRPFAAGNYISLPVGMNRMPLSRFLPYTFAGITPWAFGFMMVARTVGHLPGIGALVSAYGLPVGLGLAAIGLMGLLWKWSRRKPIPEAMGVWPMPPADQCIGD